MNKTNNGRWTTEEYKQVLKETGSGVVPLEPYVNMKTKMLHRCSCGVEWQVVPMTARKGHKCQECGRKALPQCQAKTKVQFNLELKERGYDLGIQMPVATEYFSNSKKLEAICSCGKTFITTPKYLKMSSFPACEKCRKHSEGFHGRTFYKNKKTVLYYLKVTKNSSAETAYKIGVTLFRENIQHSINERFKKDKKQVTIETIKTFLFQDGADAYDIEQYIIKDNKCYKYTKNILKSGNSELFSEDVFKKN
jgi:hypothetical protein